MVVIADAAMGVVVMLVGGVLLAGARRIADFSEQLDAIGSTHSTAETEAAWWKVSLYRAVGAFVVFLGLVFSVGGLTR